MIPDRITLVHLRYFLLDHGGKELKMADDKNTNDAKQTVENAKEDAKQAVETVKAEAEQAIQEARLTIEQAREHVPELVLSQHVHGKVHGKDLLGRLNTRVALAITRMVGSMWCAYLFALLAFVSFPAAIRSHDPLIIVSWTAQTFLQLVLLPIIIVGQNVQAAASDARAESDHQTLLAIHTLTAEVHEISLQQTQILKILEKRVGG